MDGTVALRTRMCVRYSRGTAARSRGAEEALLRLEGHEAIGHEWRAPLWPANFEVAQDSMLDRRRSQVDARNRHFKFVTGEIELREVIYEEIGDVSEVDLLVVIRTQEKCVGVVLVLNVTHHRETRTLCEALNTLFGGTRQVSDPSQQKVPITKIHAAGRGGVNLDVIGGSEAAAAGEKFDGVGSFHR